MKNIKKLVLFITLIIVVGGVNVYAANIGAKLTSPEEGWKRYDDNASEITYINCDVFHSEFSNSNYYYSGITGDSELIPEISFKFYGTKIRFIGTTHLESHRGKVKIIIDGVEYEFSQIASNYDLEILQFEKLDLNKDIHTVTITREASYTGKHMYLGAIDIDEDGYLIGKAKVGDQLLEPETGWKRYDDADSRFSYQGDFLSGTSDQYGGDYYNDTLHWVKATPVVDDTKIKFEFLGSKLRIISTVFNQYSKAFVVNVDGKEYTFSQYGDHSYQMLIAEINNLTYERHTVEIFSNDNIRYTFDAIDIDEDGALLPLNVINLTAIPNDTNIDLSWDAVADAEKYIVKRATSENGPFQTIADNVTSTSYIDTTAQPAVTYYYVVNVVKGTIVSENSNVASAMIENTNIAVLQIKLSTTDVYEYRVTMNEVDNFMKWYIDRANGTGLPFYSFSDESKIEPYTDVNEYLIFDKIIWFKVKEYLK
ncbi:hypothetical protein [Vallitalea guaymasensis]|uniref:Fibronectin type-III domain-containing protein n=1 Tax=Vallitalea guaymasensis TaxID=1185412 RepID=A0A8J8SBF5_9FIRM|nr:hypothetical protein [Vallitalea guaymasensis]QUH28286.1 hypothetical protein HYG85_04885 [Vallitalea guaymasensis]